MKIEENLLLNDLFDCYGPLLSKNQQEILKDFLFYNLTSSEIAQNRQITRQAVKDAIVKGQKKLEEIEQKLGLMKRIKGLEMMTKNREDK